MFTSSREGGGGRGGDEILARGANVPPLNEALHEMMSGREVDTKGPQVLSSKKTVQRLEPKLSQGISVQNVCEV